MEVIWGAKHLHNKSKNTFEFTRSSFQLLQEIARSGRSFIYADFKHKQIMILFAKNALEEEVASSRNYSTEDDGLAFFLCV